MILFMDNKQYISPDKRKELEAELKDLRGPKRQVILDALAYARSLGDLSENAEYHNAREDQGRLEERIAQIEHILRESIIVTSHHKTDISVGSVVTLRKKGEKGEKIYTIVGSEEADMSLGKVSNNSPVGAALLGKKKGDNITVSTPKGDSHYEIVEIK